MRQPQNAQGRTLGDLHRCLTKLPETDGTAVFQTEVDLHYDGRDLSPPQRSTIALNGRKSPSSSGLGALANEQDVHQPLATPYGAYTSVLKRQRREFESTNSEEIIPAQKSKLLPSGKEVTSRSLDQKTP